MRFGERVMPPKHAWRVDSLLLFLLTAVLLFPLWGVNYLDNWRSIESTFIADGRMLGENWSQHLWQPLWYCGTRADYVYPPGLRTGVAILSAILHVNDAHAYHIFIALFYSCGIAAVYLWVRTGTSSRLTGWLAAAGVALLSPCFLLLPDVLLDSPWRVPWRLHVLMTYGEGPHISSLSVLPLVWLGAGRRFQGGGLIWLFLSAGAAALVVSINFYGATALAVTFPLLVWSAWLERRGWRIVRDAVSIAALAYGLTAWWLVPSFLRITSRNLSLVSPAGNRWSLPVFGGLLAAYLLGTLWLWRYARWGAYPLFVWSGIGFLGAFTFGYRWFGFQVAGNLVRLLPEFDIFAILCGLEVLRMLWKWQPQLRGRLAPRIFACALLLLALLPSLRYLRHPYTEFHRDRRWQERVEYKTTSWLARHIPDQRVFVSGTIRFWHNAWFNVPQADGGSLQGILNPLMPTAQWRILAGNDPDLARYWLQALGVDVLIVPGPTSQEPYKDFVNPRMYADWPLLRDDGEGNRYYNVPRRVAGIVRIVDRTRIESIPRIPADNEKLQIQAYAGAVEALPPGGDDRDRTHYHWNGSDQWGVDAQIQPGESLLLQENYDPAWRAYVDGQVHAIQRDALGFMLLDLEPGQHSVRMAFETPAEVIAGRLLTLFTLVLMGVLGVLSRRGRLSGAL
jgi:hypothetical protein